MSRNTIEKMTYIAWYNMNRRCYDPKHQSFPTYNGKGIKVCERWRCALDEHGVMASTNHHTRWHNKIARACFKNDMGLKPEDNQLMQLSRIGDIGNYEPGNVIWDYGKNKVKNAKFPVDNQYEFQYN